MGRDPRAPGIKNLNSTDRGLSPFQVTLGLKTVSHEVSGMFRDSSPQFKFKSMVSELLCKSIPVSQNHQFVSALVSRYREVFVHVCYLDTRLDTNTQECSSFHTNQDSCLDIKLAQCPLWALRSFSHTDVCQCGQHNSREQGGALEERLASCEVSLVL